MTSKRIVKTVASAVSAVMVLSVSATNAFAAGSASASAPQEVNYFTQLILPLIIMFALLYFLFIRPQKKRDNELKEMQNNLQIGDEVVTSGGIIGIVVRKAEDNIVIETGGEKNKIRIKTYAIAENVSAIERAKEAQAAKKSPAGIATANLVDNETEKKSKKSKKNNDAE